VSFVRASAEFFVLRTPLLPFDEFERWGGELLGTDAREAGGEQDDLAAPLAEDRSRLRARLRATFDRPEIREALFIAAPGLEERYPAWIADPTGKEGQKIERALTRYFSRMCSRATPFGLFAGCSVGTIGAVSSLELAPRAHYRRHARLDCDYLASLIDALRFHPVSRGLRYRPNASAYVGAGRLRYVATEVEDLARSFRVVAAYRDPALEAALARASEGASPGDLAATLCRTIPDVTRDEAEAYVTELIHAQILESDLQLPVTGPQPVAGIVATLRSAPGGAEIADALDGADRQLRAMEATSLGVDPERYRDVARGLSRLPVAATLGRLFQVDVVKPVVRATLDPALLDEILQGGEALRCLSPAKDPLADFKRRFAARYEQNEAPLVEVLDEEAGLWRGGRARYMPSEDSPLLDGLELPSSAGRRQIPWGGREELLLGLISAAGGGKQEVAFDIERLAPLRRTAAPFSDAFSIEAILLGDPETVARGHGRVQVRAVRGPSGAKLLGRFCHLDAELRAQVERHLRAEEALSPGPLFAEVVHLPEGHAANVVLRPVLREYEIPYLGQSSAAPERQILLSELSVSVVNNRVVLRSRRLAREVLPSFTNAMNPDHGPGPYSFLTSLHAQNVCSNTAWSWEPFDRVKFLPRVVLGRVILSPARWSLGPAELERLRAAPGDACFRAVARLREALGLPRLVAFVESDNELPVDLENVLSVEAFVHHVRRKDAVQLVELLATSRSLCVSGPEGRFAHELVIPFVQDRAPTPTVPQRFPSAAKKPRFAPGSEWVYTKLYGRPSSLDHVIRTVVPEVVEPLRRAGALRRWFFVRFADPDWHLRLRLCGTSREIWSLAIPLLEGATRPLLEEGSVHRLEFATYEPEVDRYGGPEGLLLAERVFHADSEAVVEILRGAVRGDGHPDARWQLVACGMHRLLDDFEVPLRERRGLVDALRAGLLDELGGDAALERQLGLKFRAWRAELERLLCGEGAADHLAPGIEALRARSREIGPIARELRALDRAGRLETPPDAWIKSALHMFANRVFRSTARAQELVIHDLLSRFYRSRTARLRKGELNP
jgi:thiopeptide-type bacteriocin biosynthesis protein